jgi:AbrB family looped-hinge helix DNA binding protein
MEPGRLSSWQIFLLAGRLAGMTTMADRPMSAPMRTKGVLTIPQAVREQLHLEPGDNLLVSVERGRIVLTPAALVPRDQAWFHTPQWQAKEAEADEDLALGRYVRHDNDADFLASLDED